MAAACTKHPISSSIATGSIHLYCTDIGCKWAGSYANAIETCRDSITACNSCREVRFVFAAAQIFNFACTDVAVKRFSIRCGEAKQKAVQSCSRDTANANVTLLLGKLQCQRWCKAGRQPPVRCLFMMSAPVTSILCCHCSADRTSLQNM